MFPGSIGNKTGAKLDVFYNRNFLTETYVWRKPPGARLVHIYGSAAGGGGGAGITTASATTTASGEGGQAGLYVMATIPAQMLPEQLYIVIGPPGAGGTSGSAGGQAGDLYICMTPEIVSSLGGPSVAFSRGGKGGDGGNQNTSFTQTSPGFVYGSVFASVATGFSQGSNGYNGYLRNSTNDADESGWNSQIGAPDVPQFGASTSNKESKTTLVTENALPGLFPNEELEMFFKTRPGRGGFGYIDAAGAFGGGGGPGCGGGGGGYGGTSFAGGNGGGGGGGFVVFWSH